MKKRTWEEYSAYIWSRTKKDYIFCNPIRRSSLAECKDAFELKRKEDSNYMYKDCDWNDVRYFKRSYTCVEEGFVNE